MVPQIQDVVMAPPCSQSTGVTFRIHLLAVGVCMQALKFLGISSIMPKQTTEVVHYRIPAPRYNCLDQMVVGGWLDQYSECDLVEIATRSF